MSAKQYGSVEDPTVQQHEADSLLNQDTIPIDVPNTSENGMKKKLVASLAAGMTLLLVLGLSNQSKPSFLREQSLVNTVALERATADDVPDVPLALEGQTQEVFYEDIPDMPPGEVTQVMEWIKAEVTQVRSPVCWRKSYGRGAGEVLTECPGRQKIGALCYSWCPSGMQRFGFDCHSVCPSNFRDDGLFCRLSEYGRGGGYPWKFGDALNDSGMISRCERDHGRGNCEKNGAIFYPKCRSGYYSFGCCICRPTTPNCGSLGLKNGIDLSCAKKVQIGDPIPMSCKSGLQKDAALCYPYCRTGYHGVGPVCWQSCDNDQTDCGAQCISNGDWPGKATVDCVSSIADKVVSTAVLAANIATLGLATPATGGASAAAETLKVGGKVVTGQSKVAKAFIKFINLAQTVDPGNLAQGAKVTQRIYQAKLGTKLRTVNTVRKVATQTYKAGALARQIFIQDFAQQTSSAIASTLDSHFPPTTAAYLKGFWGDMQLKELAATNGFNTAATALDAISIADISGITGVIAAFFEPTCAEVVPFPCVSSASNC